MELSIRVHKIALNQESDDVFDLTVPAGTIVDSIKERFQVPGDKTMLLLQIANPEKTSKSKMSFWFFIVNALIGIIILCSVLIRVYRAKKRTKP